MNRQILTIPASLLLALVLAACAGQTRDEMAITDLRSDLNELRSDRELAPLAPMAIAEAERAVRRATESGLNESEHAHRVRIARKRLEIARTEALHGQTRQEIEEIESRRNRLLIRASRMEVDMARQEAEQARMVSAATMEEIERARQLTEEARQQEAESARREAEAREETEQVRRVADARASEIELARREAELASEQARSLQRRLEYLELRETDRGVVLTLGDVLFEVGRAELQPGTDSNLADVVELLETEPEKRVRIEGHTDSTGPSDLNLRLSEQRANSVADALIALGIDPDRVTTVGMGEDFPVATNETNEGRASNRRVDVILLDD